MNAKKFYSAAAAFFVAAALILFLTDPARYAKSVWDGIALWAVSVLPATFPMLFFVTLFTGLPAFSALSEKLSAPMGKLFCVSGAGGGLMILSALSGYPVGARALLDLGQGGALKGEETRLACLCTTSGPAFLVGTVGAVMYGSPRLGWIMLVSHLLAVWTPFLFIRRPKRPPQTARAVLKKSASLYDSVLGAVLSVLCVGGLIALFNCFSEMLSSFGLFRLLDGYGEGVARGLLEMTGGCAALSAYRTPLSAALSCAVVTFGGLCVLAQQSAFLSRAGVKLSLFFLVKLLQAALAFAICFGAAQLFL